MLKTFLINDLIVKGCAKVYILNEFYCLQQKNIND